MSPFEVSAIGMGFLIVSELARKSSPMYAVSQGLCGGFLLVVGGLRYFLS